MALVDEELTHIVIGAFHTVYNRLGCGFLENVYVGAMEHECAKRGLQVGREVPIAVCYDGKVVGTYRADLIIERRLIVEIKACDGSHRSHDRQIFNYLRATELEVGLLLSFGDRPTQRRSVLRNSVKRLIQGPGMPQ